MKQYLDLCKKILEEGTYKDDRTGTGTYSIFGYQARYDLSKGFPLVTTKKVFLRGIIHELLWFICGDTNIKYLVDNEFKDLKGEALNEAIREKINNKAADLKGTNQTLGTTPRQITDLLGSLCDLTSGSGDKGTPIILVQGYFDNFSSK